ncbi:hypothetical protein Rsub_00583 [Raphidocelis subcapitata]|uniref:Uncharacterized protein n=1 Tax=Raphidocelis subcapitata TaxID=307507 RepID=A0A2V0NKL7_9CHLO|nr:hypothetical protein Rsub_00583 [Raphidocelis subcapitata]|eukprot:GBF87871.1 hypothetical protein Rsub_00583 [Raphidocelis subcapitata]
MSRLLRSMLGAPADGSEDAEGAAPPAGAAPAPAAAPAAGGGGDDDGDDEFETDEDEDASDYESDDDDDDDDDGIGLAASDDSADADAGGPLWFLHAGSRARRGEPPPGCRPLHEVERRPLGAGEHPIVMEVAVATAGAGPRHAAFLGRGDAAPGGSGRALSRRAEAGLPPTYGSGGVTTRSRAAARGASGSGGGGAHAEAGDGPEAPSSGGRRTKPRRSTGDGGGGSWAPEDSGWLNTTRLLAARELGLARGAPGFARSQQRHILCERHLPVHPCKVRDKMDSRAYIGQYSGDGRFFVAAYQDKRVRLYDVTHPGTSAACTSTGDRDRTRSSLGSGSLGSGSLGSGSFGGNGGGGARGGGGGGGGGGTAHEAGGWRLRKDVTTRMTRWTITDTALSPDNRFLVYATIAPVAYMVHVGGPLDLVESMANVTEVHEAISFVPRREGARGSEEDDGSAGFGIWSVAWSPGGGEIIAGTSDSSVYIYDFESKRVTSRLLGHGDDVNAVCYLDDSSPHMIVSGSDDTHIKVWDRRLAGVTCRRPVGVLLGHTEGLTHLSARGDGRYILSNAKDQTARLWDVRRMRSPQEARELPPFARPLRFDYRWQPYPASGYEVAHPYDSSIQTYRGHRVLQTLIRAYFSPAHSTGQRYVYSGSSCGRIFVWDLVTAKEVSVLSHHRAIVRDCSWHPYEPELSSVSWDGTLVSWDAAAPAGGEECAALRREAAGGGDRFDGYY